MPKPSLDIRKKFYDSVYSGMDGILASWFSPSETFAAWKTKTTIEKFFSQDVKNGMNVLDLGCGIGSDIFSLNLYCQINKINVNFYGLDISKNAIDLARRTAKIRGYDNCKFIVGDVEAFSLGKKFDIILSSQTLEHTVDMKAAMKRIHEHLKPGGVFIMSLPFADRIKPYAPMFIKKQIWKGSEWGLKKGGKHMEKAVKMEKQFESTGDGSHLAHASLLTLKQIRRNLEESGFKHEASKRAFMVEGNRWFDDHPTLFAMMIIADKLIPFKRFGSDIIIKARKN